MVGDPDELLDKCDMIWPPRASEKFHANLLRCMMPLSIIAVLAGANQILPGISSTINFRDNMIDGHIILFLPAILTFAGIPLNDIFPCKQNSLEWDSDEKIQSDDGRDRYMIRL